MFTEKDIAVDENKTKMPTGAVLHFVIWGIAQLQEKVISLLLSISKYVSKIVVKIAPSAACPTHTPNIFDSSPDTYI